MTLLTALIANEGDLTRFHARLKLANVERSLCEFLLAHRDDDAISTSRQNDDEETRFKHYRHLFLKEGTLARVFVLIC